MATKEKSKKTKTIIKAAVIIGVLIIPLFYSFFYLGAFSDPYAHLQDVPVAVVNLDKGATINGETRNLGDEISKNLKENGSLEFHFVDKEEATKGVKDSKYYAEILIPEDLSSCVSTASKDTKKIQGKITYIANQKRNYLAAQILENAMPTIKETVNSSIDKEVTQTLCDKIDSVPSQLGILQDGLSQLYDGSVKLNNGAGTLKDGLSTLSNGTNKLSKNVPALTSGVGDLANGAGRLSSGLNSLNSKVPALASGVSQINSATNQVNDGVKQISSNSADLRDGASQVNAGVNQLIDTTKNSTTSVVNGLETVKSGLNTAFGDETTEDTLIYGSNQIYQQMLAASKNNKNITDTQKQQISDGAAAQADENTTAIAKGVANMVASSVANNKTSAGQLASANILNDTTVKSQILPALIAGYKSLGMDDATATATANGAIQTIAKGVAENTVTTVSTQLSSNDSVSQLTTGLSPYVKQIGSGVAAGVVDTINQNLKATFKTASDGAKTLYDGTKSAYSQLTYGVQSFENQVVSSATDPTSLASLEKLKTGVAKLDTGATAYTTNVDYVSTVLEQMAAGTTTLNNSVPTLKSGVAQLADGAKTLSNGTATLNSKVPALADGVNQLTDGASKLLAGANTLKGGTGEISSNLKIARDGVNDTVADTNSQLGALDGLADYTAAPVATDTSYVFPVANYGTAFAPYFMSLSLWVGGLMIFFGIFLDYNKKIKTLSKDSDRIILRDFVFLIIGLAQAGLLAFVIKYALHLTVNNMGLLIFACCLVSMAFISIIQFCIVHLGDVGKFVSLLLLILQLTSCAGTFPIETVPKFFKVLYPYMPMTYSTLLFKEAISGEWNSIALKSTLILAGICIVFTIITMILSSKKYAKSIKDAIESANENTAKSKEA